VPLEGPWTDQITAPVRWHRAQLSIVYPGYPRRDPEESTANHRFRRDRHAAHVDGLLPLGPARRRYLKEPHAFILGLPLNDTRAAPLMVYPGSHEIMGAAFAALAEADDPTEVDVTEFYQATRREVFARITPRPVHARPGEAILLHRHLLHGVAARADGDEAPPEGRMVAYFRPLTSARRWLGSP
jgi:ectoine hydroxylase-related dioxygenase (phytanoyl-CoA dioxygenase family)